MALPPGVMPIQDYLFYALLGLSCAGILMLAMFIIITIWTPAMTFLKAKLTKKPIFFMGGRDGLGGFFVPNKSESEYAIFKKKGVFGIIRGSHIFDRKSKQPIYLADKDIGASIKREWPKILEQLKVSFPKNLRDGKDYKNIVLEAEKNKDDPDKNPELVLAGATINVSDLASYFPLNIKPTYIHAYGEIAKRQERRKQDQLKWLVGFAALLICIGIAGYLLMGQVNKGKMNCECNFGEALAIAQAEAGQTPSGGVQKVQGNIKVIPELDQDVSEQAGAKLT